MDTPLGKYVLDNMHLSAQERRPRVVLHVHRIVKIHIQETQPVDKAPSHEARSRLWEDILLSASPRQNGVHQAGPPFRAKNPLLRAIAVHSAGPGQPLRV